MASPLHPTPPTPETAPRPLGALVAPLRAEGLLAAPLGADAEDVQITGLADDSRAVRPGTLFGAISADTDAGRDGHDFVPAALGAGAAAAIVRADYHLPASGAAPTGGPPPEAAPEPLGKGEGTAPDGTPSAGPALSSAVLVRTTDSRAALAEVAAAFFARPADSLALLGVTGTNGKTTTAVLLHGLLSRLGETAGLIGTVENRIGHDRYATAYTTPEAIGLQSLLAAMRDRHVTHVAMEVSSHGLALDRVRTLAFRAAVFTNLSHDHLDFHKTPEAYAAAKRRLFDGLREDAVAVVNADDEASGEMTSRTRARIVSYGTASEADIRVAVLENALEGLRLRLDGHERRFRVAGRFNALNLAAAYAVARDLGYEAAETLDALADLPGVPGRFETVRSEDGVLGVVDYAHTPDALANVLATAREIVPEGSALWVVFGAGGDRDRAKRPEMGAAASRLADRVVVTSDNPRTESPEAIIEDVSMGLVAPADEIVDRAEAIAHAAREAAAGDVIVVAGKGHEDYQIIGAEKRDFDDREHLRAAFARRGEGASGQRPAASPPANSSPPGQEGPGGGDKTNTTPPEASGATGEEPGARHSEPGTHPARG